MLLLLHKEETIWPSICGVNGRAGVPREVAPDRHGRGHSAIDPAVRPLFRELLVFSRVPLGHHVAETRSQDRIATVPEVTGEDRPLQFLDGCGHAGEALAELRHGGGPRHQEVAQLVLAVGANPNITDRDGVSPLDHAREKGQAEIARLIEAAGGR